MTSLVAVASHVPPTSVDVGELLAALGETDNADLYERFYGFARVRREPDRSLADQMYAAAGKLVELRGRERDVRYLVHAPTIQNIAPYPDNPLWTLRASLGLGRALPFSLSQHACASALLAVDVCGRLLGADGDPDGLALVLAGEKTFTRVAQVLPHNAVMGETVAAILVSASGERDRLLAYATRTLGEFHQAPSQPPELDEKFQGLYSTTLGEVILAAAARAGVGIADVALVLPHNVNRMSWLRIARQIGLPKTQLVLDNQAELGHCFGADPFVNYQTACERGRLRPGDVYVMTGAGLGATIAAMVFQH